MIQNMKTRKKNIKLYAFVRFFLFFYFFVLSTSTFFCW